MSMNVTKKSPFRKMGGISWFSYVMLIPCIPGSKINSGFRKVFSFSKWAILSHSITCQSGGKKCAKYCSIHVQAIAQLLIILPHFWILTWKVRHMSDSPPEYRKPIFFSVKSFFGQKMCNLIWKLSQISLTAGHNGK